jgi:NAD(P)-dependent dehydrogenase (short-subunit alcohol dehydrogenase family)
VGLAGLRDRVVLVTGGAAGIGYATVARLVDEGARVAVVDVNAGALDRGLEQLGDADVIGIQADVTSEDDVARAFATARERFGRIDSLHNNAGIEGTVKPIAEMPLADFDHVMNVNLRGTFLVLREMMRTVAVQGGPATIVNTAAAAGAHGIPGFIAYSATKAGIISFTRTAAREGAEIGVRVNAVLPGPVDTGLFANLPDELRAGAISGIPMGRLGLPEEVAALVVWLLSDESPYVTGGLYNVDGGELS